MPSRIVIEILDSDDEDQQQSPSAQANRQAPTNASQPVQVDDDASATDDVVEFWESSSNSPSRQTNELEILSESEDDDDSVPASHSPSPIPTAATATATATATSVASPSSSTLLVFDDLDSIDSERKSSPILCACSHSDFKSAIDSSESSSSSSLLVKRSRLALDDSDDDSKADEILDIPDQNVSKQVKTWHSVHISQPLRLFFRADPQQRMHPFELTFSSVQHHGSRALKVVQHGRPLDIDWHGREYFGPTFDMIRNRMALSPTLQMFGQLEAPPSPDDAARFKQLTEFLSKRVHLRTLFECAGVFDQTGATHSGALVSVHSTSIHPESGALNFELHAYHVHPDELSHASLQPLYQRVLAGRRLKLVLDIDQTLLQAVNMRNQPMHAIEQLESRGAKPIHFSLVSVPSVESFLVFLRPGVREFLRHAFALADISVCSAGTQPYIDAIGTLLRESMPELPWQDAFEHMVSVHDPQQPKVAQPKHLTRVYPFAHRNRMQGACVIIDDAPQAWRDSKRAHGSGTKGALITIGKFEPRPESQTAAGRVSPGPLLNADNVGHFGRGDIDEAMDPELARCARLLERLHASFFAQVDQHFDSYSSLSSSSSSSSLLSASGKQSSTSSSISSSSSTSAPLTQHQIDIIKLFLDRDEFSVSALLENHLRANPTEAHRSPSSSSSPPRPASPTFSTSFAPSSSKSLFSHSASSSSSAFGPQVGVSLPSSSPPSSSTAKTDDPFKVPSRSELAGFAAAATQHGFLSSLSSKPQQSSSQQPAAAAVGARFRIPKAPAAPPAASSAQEQPPSLPASFLSSTSSRSSVTIPSLAFEPSFSSSLSSSATAASVAAATPRAAPSAGHPRPPTRVAPSQSPSIAVKENWANTKPWRPPHMRK